MTEPKKELPPNPNEIYPLKQGIKSVIYLKSIKHHNFVAGDFSYGADDFEKGILYHYDFSKDRLIIGKFCSIAKGVKFFMNDANHNYDCVSTYPFLIMKGFKGKTFQQSERVYKGDTVLGNDVWVGENATIMPGIKIGNGAIIAANSHVVKNVPAYCIVGGNPAKIIRKRFDDEMIELLEELQWWNFSIERINEIIEPVLSNNDLVSVKKEIKNLLNK